MAAQRLHKETQRHTGAAVMERKERERPGLYEGLFLLRKCRWVCARV